MYKGEEAVKHIYKTWLDEDSPCSECPIYDKRGCRMPFYGHGTFNEVGEVDVMVIGEAPGPASQKDTPSDGGQQRPINEFTREKIKSQIYEAFNGNSPNFKYFADALQRDFDSVYFTNLLKCNNLEEQDGNEFGSWVDVDRLGNSHNYEYDTDQGLQSEGNLNEEAKKRCSEHLKFEISALNPSVVVCLGKSHIKRVYEIFNMDVPDVPTYLEDRRDHEIKLNSEYAENKISTTVIPSYHFARPRFESNINQCGFVDENADPSTRRKTYWDKVIETVNSAIV